MRALLAIALALYLDARVALWGCLAGLADRAHHHTTRAQHHAATRFGRAVCARWP